MNRSVSRARGTPKWRRRFRASWRPGFASLAGIAILLAASPASADATKCWTAAWTSAQIIPTGDQPVPREWLEDATIRQTVRIGLTGASVRLRLSNVHGTAPLAISAVTVARPVLTGGARVEPRTLHQVLFDGTRATMIPAGAEMWSDPVPLPVAAGDDIAVSIYLPHAPETVTGHPGSRATSWFIHGDRTGDADLPAANSAPRWLLLAGVDVSAGNASAAVAFGDSITDGFGVQPDTNARWTDALAIRLRTTQGFSQVAVLNAGIGGNRLRLDGLGPNALARFDRDVLSHPGVTHVIVLEGVNDLGTLTREAPATEDAHRAMVGEAISVLREMVRRARERGIVALGGTILPYGASSYYHPDARNEADRQAINGWIRARGNFDAVIDFDAALRDPERPELLRLDLDSGDGLHPSLAGYRAMADAVPLGLLAPPARKGRSCAAQPGDRGR